MKDNAHSEPATKADLKKLAQTTKTDLDAVKAELKSDIHQLGEKVHQLDGKVSQLDGKVSQLDGKVSQLDGKVSQLDGKVSQLDGKVSQLDGGLKDVSGEILKVNFRLDSIEYQLKNNVATKDDFNRLYNLMDSISGSVKNYQRQDVLRGDKIMTHDEKLKNHDGRLIVLENPHQ